MYKVPGTLGTSWGAGSLAAKKSARYESASQDYDEIEKSQQLDL